MPPLVIAANVIGGAVLSAAAGIAAITGLTTFQVFLAAGALAGGLIMKRRADKAAAAAREAALRDRLVMVATTDRARSILLGRVRNCDGVLFKGAWGPKGEYYTMVVAIGMGESDAFEKIYFGDEEVTVDGSGLVTSAPYGVIRKESRSQSFAVTPGASNTIDIGEAWRPGTLYISHPQAGRRSVPITITGTSGTTATFNAPADVSSVDANYQVDVQKSYARVYKFLGTDAQDLSGMLSTRFPGMVTSEHKFRGITCLLVDLSWDETAFPSGIEPVSAQVRGAKVYDPRTGVTAWSENPALCARHIAMHQHAGAAAASDIDEDALITAANACDVTHTYTDSNGASTTRAMYTCSYVASTEVSPNAHMDELAEAMAGRWAHTGGRIRVKAGVYTAPVMTITDDMLSSNRLAINPGPGQEGLVNVLRPTIADAGQNRVVTPITPVRAASYIAVDGRELPQEVTLAAVDFAPQAQHICAIQLREMRQGMTTQWPVNMRGFPLEIFDVVSVVSSRFGFTPKTFEVLGTGFSLQGGVDLSLKETGASIYVPDDEFPANDPEPNTSLPRPWLVPTVTGVVAESGTDHLLLQADGTVMSRVAITFDEIEDEAVINGGRIEVQYRTPGEEWQMMLFDGGVTTAYLMGLRDLDLYMIRVRARNKLCAGDWSEQIYHVVQGKQAQPADVGVITATAVTGGIKLAWPGSTEADRQSTMLRLGATWGASTLLYDVPEPEASYIWPWPADGAYTILARRVDTSGNQSAGTASATITITGQDIAVQSAQIKDNAATEVSQTDIDYTTFPGMPDGFDINTLHVIPDTQATNYGGLVSLSIPGNYNGKYIVTVTVDVRFRVHWSSDAVEYWYSYQEHGLFSAAKVNRVYDNVDATRPGGMVTYYFDRQSQFVVSAAFDVVNGVTGRTAALWLSQNDLFNKFYIVRSSVRTERIKK